MVRIYPFKVTLQGYISHYYFSRKGEKFSILSARQKVTKNIDSPNTSHDFSMALIYVFSAICVESLFENMDAAHESNRARKARGVVATE